MLKRGACHPVLQFRVFDRGDHDFDGASAKGSLVRAAASGAWWFCLVSDVLLDPPLVWSPVSGRVRDPQKPRTSDVSGLWFLLRRSVRHVSTIAMFEPLALAGSCVVVVERIDYFMPEFGRLAPETPGAAGRVTWHRGVSPQGTWGRFTLFVLRALMPRPVR